MKKIIISLFVLSVCLVSKAQIISDEDNKLVEKIKQENIKHTTISSDFKQTRHLSILGEDVQSSGKFYYKKPDYLAMWYDNPAGDLMLINENRFVMINAGKRNETKSTKMQGMKTILSACLQGDVKQIAVDKITCEETSRYYIVSADIPKKSNKSNISRVVLSFEKSDLTLSILRTDEPDGSYTIYELVGKVMDKDIDGKVFQAPKK